MTLVNQDMEKDNWSTHVHKANWSTWVLSILRPNTFLDNWSTRFYFSEMRECTESQLVDQSGRGICMINIYINIYIYKMRMQLQSKAVLKKE